MTGVPAEPAIVLVAVKPQMMGDALPVLRDKGDGATLFVSVAAGTPIAHFEQALGAEDADRAGDAQHPRRGRPRHHRDHRQCPCSAAQLDQAEMLLRAVGQVVRLEAEDQMDAVTGVSGSGPAYVFHMIECMAKAGEAQGLSPDLAMQLAQATVAGAGRAGRGRRRDARAIAPERDQPQRHHAGGAGGADGRGKRPAAADGRTVAAAADRSRELRDG